MEFSRLRHSPNVYIPEQVSGPRNQVGMWAAFRDFALAPSDASALLSCDRADAGAKDPYDWRRGLLKRKIVRKLKRRITELGSGMEGF